LATVLLVSVMGCGGRTSLDGMNEGGPDAATAVDASVDECAECLALACTDTLTECTLDDACLTIYQCADTGSGDCVCQTPTGASAYFALVECIQAVACQVGTCTTACGRASAPYCETALEAPVCVGVDAGHGGSRDACDACAARSCASFVAACAAATACEAYVACLPSAPPGTSAGAVCADEHPGGQASAEALDVCLGGACETECGF
jgi:hypothetical protein